MTTQAIRDDINRLQTESAGIIVTSKGKLTDPQRSRLDSIEAEFKELDRRVDGAEVIDANQPVGGLGGNGYHRSTRKDGADWASMCSRTGTAWGDDEWDSPGEFFDAIRTGGFHPKLKRAMGENFGPDGGYAVPTAMAAGIMDSSLESEIVRPRARVIALRTNEYKLPAWDDVDRATDGLYGGFSAHWESEASSLSTDDAKLRQVQLHAKKLAFLGQVSTELIEDSESFASEFQGALSRAAGFFLDQAFLTGTGAGRPLGILNAACTVEVAKETGQVAATVEYDNLTKMFARILPESRNRAVWVCSNTLIPELLSLSHAVGTGGSHIPVLSERNGEFSMLTRPVIFTEKLPVLGTVGDIMLADISGYAVGMRTHIALMASPHVRFTNDEVVFRLRVRVDGQPVLSAPVTPTNGDTMSHFVTLGTRA
jgi:HK97 family phage major capsid protein